MENKRISADKKQAEMILFAINELMDALYNANEVENNIDISAALGEACINGKVYQIQIHLVNNKKLWQKENGVQFRDAVKVYE
jgi:hypothetical protein